jgi:hypothetical protein
MEGSVFFLADGVAERVAENWVHFSPVVGRSRRRRGICFTGSHRRLRGVSSRLRQGRIVHGPDEVSSIRSGIRDEGYAMRLLT